MKRRIYIFNVKYFAGKRHIFSHFPILLYINLSPTLPSLCKALHNDGFGEGLEQHPIKTKDLGDVYVSFWNDSNDWSLQTEEEMSQEQGLDMKM